VFFAIAFVVGLRVIPWIGQKMVNAGRGQAFTVIILIGLVYAEGAHLAGMHGILGAFLAGLFLRDSVIGRTLKTEIMGLVKDASVGFLAPIFFVTAGFAVSLDVIWREPGLLLAVIGLATLGKVVGTALFYLPTGHGWREGVVLGAAMNGRGAVEIIIAQIGLTMGLITQDIFSVLVFMAIATTATVPVFLKLGSDWLRRRGELARTSEDRDQTLIIGAGPLARALATTIPNATLVDRNAAHCEDAARVGLSAVNGDALDERVLAEAGAAQAKAVITLTGNPEVDVLCAKLTRDTFLVPDIYLASYSTDGGGHAETVRHLGARTLFGGDVSLTEWDFRIERGTADVVTELVETDVKAQELLSGVQKAGVLVLAAEADGSSTPFHGSQEVQAGAKVSLLRDTATRPTDALSPLFAAAPVVDIASSMDLPAFLGATTSVLAPLVDETPESLASWISEREHVSSTVLERGIAIPHVRLPGQDKVALVMARSKEGISFPGESEPVHAAFLLATSDDKRGDHLRILAALARIVSSDSFIPEWLAAADSDRLRRLIETRYTMLDSTSTNSLA
ncbi:MAG: PTS transporter subunit EIIA, partial [Rhodothermales bacterium]|nr:PTS transporter subunit EIIA [Rhodothermales bacterium]